MIYVCIYTALCNNKTCIRTIDYVAVNFDIVSELPVIILSFYILNITLWTAELPQSNKPYARHEF